MVWGTYLMAKATTNTRWKVAIRRSCKQLSSLALPLVSALMNLFRSQKANTLSSENVNGTARPGFCILRSNAKKLPLF